MQKIQPTAVYRAQFLTRDVPPLQYLTNISGQCLQNTGVKSQQDGVAQTVQIIHNTVIFLFYYETETRKETVHISMVSKRC